MVRSPHRGKRVVQAATIAARIWVFLFAGLSIYSIAQFRSWTTRLEVVAFFAGFGGAALMFLRWRRHGDRLAQVLCLAAFVTWGLAALTWGVGGKNAGKPGSVGFDVAAAALLIGFAGGIIVLIRLYMRKARANNARPQ